jgi:hypothetical protein
VSIIINEEKNDIRRYLLGQLEEAEEERLELRLLTEPSFGDEFDMIVDEITDEYVGNELDAEERERVEEHFLKSAERQQKVEFARELLERAATERGQKRVVVTEEPGFWERVRAFWNTQSLSMRTGMTIATIVIVAGLGVLVISQFRPTGTYASINLTINRSDRATGSEVKRVKLEPDATGLRIELALPDEVPQAQNYRVEVLDERQQSRNVTVTERTAKSLLVTIPADDLSRGTNIIRLYAINPDGSDQRIRGSYFFNVE